MSKLHETYLHLKETEPDSENTLYLFRAGIFFLFLEDDAKKMSSLLKLKLSNLSENVVKCGFPVASLDKYLSILENTPYQIKIINTDSHTNYSLTDYSLNSEIKFFLLRLLDTDINILSVREAYEFLDTLKVEAEKLLKSHKEL